jgi:hypothetical protein
MFPGLSSFGNRYIRWETMFSALLSFGKPFVPGLHSFGRHVQKTMFPGLSSFEKQWLGNTVSCFPALGFDVS